MDKRLWVAGFSLGLVLSASACSEVDNCEPGDDGCIGGPCADDAECKFELECVSVGARTLCGEEQALGGYDCGEDVDCKNATPVQGGGDGDGDGDGDSPLPCSCTGADQPCVPGTSNVCVNYCEDPGFAISVDDRRATQQLPCRADSNGNAVSFEAACQATWRQYCLRAPLWCSASSCDENPGRLSGVLDPEAQAFCADFNDVNELATYCEVLRDSTCETFPECRAPAVRTCAEPSVCTNTCEFPKEGACDDGDLGTAAFGVCDWGTDCGDCGPRRGTPPVVPVAIGGLCVSHAQCDGYSDDLRKNKSWCLSVSGTGSYRCMADCTRADNCPDGYSCFGIQDADGAPIEQDDLVAGVCNPLICEP